MRQHHEITARLEELMQEKEHLEEWYDSAYKRYSDDRTMWGAEADRGELSEVESHLTNVNARIKTLEWVLTDNTDTP